MAKKKTSVVEVTIPVSLDNKEIEELGRDLAKKEEQVQGLDRQKRESAAEFRLAIKKLRADIEQLSTAITTGRMERSVKARVEKRGGQVEYYHPKTGALLYKRAMQEEELQDDLDFEGAE